jgi:hypothetical protein
MSHLTAATVSGTKNKNFHPVWFAVDLSKLGIIVFFLQIYKIIS